MDEAILMMKLYPYFRGYLFAFAFIVNFHVLANREHQEIRNLETACAYYLVPKSNSTFGNAVTKDLDPENLKAWAKGTNANLKDYDLYAVGVPFNRGERNALMGEIKDALDSLSSENPQLKKLDIKVIRRVADFLEDRRGIFELREGELVKVAHYNPNDPRVDEKVLEELAKRGNPVVIVGTPLFGKAQREMQEKLLPVLQNGGHVVTLKSSFVEGLKKAVLRPDKALQHAAEQMRYQLPIREDFQRSTSAEISSTKKKLIVPGVLTFAFQNQPLIIRIPITVVNALNSGACGVYRTFLANWHRRSQSFFPSKLFKQVLLSILFSADLYWAGQGSHMVAALSFAGWHHFFMTKWLSILFQTAWRTPYHNLVYKWERWRNSKFKSIEDNEHTRSQASALEKSMSYIMTQAFIFSLLSKDNLFAIAQNSVEGFVLRFDALLPSDTPLMAFNWGHAFMAAVGGATMMIMGKPELLSPLARLAERLDNWENIAISKLSSLVVSLKKKCVDPFAKLFRPEKSTADEGPEANDNDKAA